MAHFQFENAVQDATRLDRPVERGPLMRWQRKALEQGLHTLSLSDANGNNALIQGSRSAKTPNRITPRTPKSALSTPGRMGLPSSPSLDCLSPGGRKVKPLRSPFALRSPFSTKTRKVSSAKTPKSAAGDLAFPQADRFIPNRSTTDLEAGHYYMMRQTSCDEEGQVTTPSKLDYQHAVSDTLNSVPTDPTESKILSFKGKAPKVQAGHVNNLKVLYSCVPSAPKANNLRHIPKQPANIMDAPDLLDDYYLNLLSWSHSNHLAIALDKAAYIWNAKDGDIIYGPELQEQDEYVTSVSWIQEGSILAVGNSMGQVQLFDSEAQKMIRTMTGHTARVGSLAWNSYILSSGSRSGAIHHHDVRVAQHHVGTLNVHTQEVCGLEWSSNGRHLASGANDNLLCIWDSSMAHECRPLFTCTEHQAAVKAIAWCPWQPSLLASGGGTADRCIKLWNVNTGTLINSLDTKSQVCDMLWSETYKELVSGHGFAQNQITLWKYPSMSVVGNLKGHSARILSLALSPDGTTVASVAGDETLQLWKCFQVEAKERKSSKSEKSTSKSMFTKSIR